MKNIHLILPNNRIIRPTNNIRIYKQKLARANNVIIHLGEILSNIHYDTHRCINCEWVDDSYDQWYTCTGCYRYICEQNNEQKDKYIVCEGCK